MKAIRLSVLSIIMLFAYTSSVKAQDADEILKKHEKAVGGLENWNKIKTITKAGSLSAQGMDITITECLDINNALRMDFSVMGMSGYQIVTTKNGYMLQPGPGQPKIDTMPPEVLKMAQQQLDEKNTQFLDYKTKGSKVEYTGNDSVDNTPCYKIKITDKDGNEATAYFDVSTYYLLRTAQMVKQENQEQEVIINFKDYNKLAEGVVMPMSVTTAMGEIVFKSIEINKPIDEKIFIPILPSAAGK